VPQVKVVTDSTSDLPPEIREALGISVVPLNVHFGEETYLDGVEISSDEFLARLATSKTLPKTSAPSPDAFRKAYEAALPEATGVLCVTLSSKLSGTHNSAHVAAQAWEGAPVRVVDSATISMGTGFAAIAAAEAARDGASLEEAERAARDTLGRSQIRFYLDTLEYLQRGGRIGRARGLVGSILRIKPVLTIEDGEVAPRGRARTLNKAVDALAEMAEQLRDPERMAVIWGRVEEERDRLLDRLAKKFPREDIVVTKYSPVLGVYGGSGVLGVIGVDRPGGA
jgi:DegV family protein with EDD domain